MSHDPTRKNRLAGETSPYLLQHATNPVEWYPWGPEALEKARTEDKPIFLSVGYSACHWCHVMERESFENEAIARLLAQHFVSIKVDREERPDIDEIYMKAVQAMTGQGGWPMSVFLTPDLRPFWGGTYFPPRRAYGRPGFAEILESLARLWREDRPRAIERGKQLAQHVADEGRAQSAAAFDPTVLERSQAMLTQAFDSEWGGFGSAPKFPHAVDLRLFLRHSLRTGEKAPRHVALHSLERMAAGGIHDQLGGGFHRYSVDERWLIPHFEKMLYDNALLVPAYLEAHLVTGEGHFSEAARRACDWALREMTTPAGGFASAQDADSEGEEGKYFAWTPRELELVLGSKLGRQAAVWFGVTDEGNFEHGKSALWRPQSAEAVAKELKVERAELEASMARARDALLAARATRVPPMTDDKVLASWNGLMISALAMAHQTLGDARYLDAARRAARYVLSGMRQPDGRLFATARNGRAHLNAYLDDYAFMIQALLDLHESDFEPAWIREALALERVLAARFEDAQNGGFFTTSSDHEALIARLKSPHDGALPSGNGVHALNLLRLAQLTGSRELAARAERTLQAFGALVNAYPAGFSQLLLAADWVAARPREIVVAGDLDSARARQLLTAVRGTFRPQRVVAVADARSDAELLPLLEGKSSGDHGARAYVCRDWSCAAPIDDPNALRDELARRG